MLLNKDGPSGTVDVVLDDIVVHAGGAVIQSMGLRCWQTIPKKSNHARQSGNGGDHKKNEETSDRDAQNGCNSESNDQSVTKRPFIASIPPLLSIQQIRIWSGLQRFNPSRDGIKNETKDEKISKEAIHRYHSSRADSGMSDFRPAVHPPVFLNARCIKISATDVEVTLTPDCPKDRLVAAIHRLFDDIYSRCGVPEAVYRLIKATKGLTPIIALPSPIAYLDFKIERSSFAFLTGFSVAPSNDRTASGALQFTLAKSMSNKIRSTPDFGTPSNSGVLLSSGFSSLRRPSVWGDFDSRPSAHRAYDSVCAERFLTSTSLIEALRIREDVPTRPIDPSKRQTKRILYQDEMKTGRGRKKRRRLHDRQYGIDIFNDINEYSQFGGSPSSPPSSWRWEVVGEDDVLRNKDVSRSGAKCCPGELPILKTDLFSGILYRRVSIDEQRSSLSVWAKIGTPLILLSSSNFLFHWAYHSGTAITAEHILGQTDTLGQTDALGQTDTLGQTDALGHEDIEVGMSDIRTQGNESESRLMRLKQRLESSPLMQYYIELTRTSEILWSAEDVVGAISTRVLGAEHAVPFISVRLGHQIWERTKFSTRPLSVCESLSRPNSVLKVCISKKDGLQNPSVKTKCEFVTPVSIELTGTLLEIQQYLECNLIPALYSWNVQTLPTSKKTRKDNSDNARPVTPDLESDKSAPLETSGLKASHSKTADLKSAHGHSPIPSADLFATHQKSESLASIIEIWENEIDMPLGLQWKWSLLSTPAPQTMLICPMFDVVIPSAALSIKSLSVPNRPLFDSQSIPSSPPLSSLLTRLKSTRMAVSGSLDIPSGIFCSHSSYLDHRVVVLSGTPIEPTTNHNTASTRMSSNQKIRAPEIAAYKAVKSGVPPSPTRSIPNRFERNVAILDLSSISIRGSLSVGKRIVLDGWDYSTDAPMSTEVSKADVPIGSKIPVFCSASIKIRGMDLLNNPGLRNSLIHVCSKHSDDCSLYPTPTTQSNYLTFDPTVHSSPQSSQKQPSLFSLFHEQPSHLRRQPSPHKQSFPRVSPNRIPRVLFGPFISEDISTTIRRQTSCLFCQLPFAFDVQPESIASALQLFGLPFCQSSFSRSSPATHQMRSSSNASNSQYQNDQVIQLIPKSPHSPHRVPEQRSNHSRSPKVQEINMTSETDRANGTSKEVVWDFDSIFSCVDNMIFQSDIKFEVMNIEIYNI